jgi:hypothetical protein
MDRLSKMRQKGFSAAGRLSNVAVPEAQLKDGDEKDPSRRLTRMGWRIREESTTRVRVKRWFPG